MLQTFEECIDKPSFLLMGLSPTENAKKVCIREEIRLGDTFPQNMRAAQNYVDVSRVGHTASFAMNLD